ncbi:Putative major facilitator, sugar transporter, major facilitator superfamily [Colletotrichum destructivum]|uniref:Major facilitator, sugar transporter, major facilitator superfamily n=1 Tax=Colletotrichum destructivum TaxID=34406 RepID=A0AAX4IHG0_9PEZI|nr:Putative major facilitator, sugar transporter, major facilitator superfamily [Colletotrichum destructivum]
MSHAPDVEGDLKSKLGVSHVEHSNADYTRNIEARIRNPLLGISKPDLVAQVDAFCREFGFPDKQDVFLRGALAAQHPDLYESLDELTDDDRRALGREVTHRWHLPRDLYLSVALCSLGSAIQGWDNTGANGANLSFPREFGIDGPDHQALVGVVNAAPTLFGLISAWAADPINDRLGRRGTIFLTGLFCVFPVLAQAFTRNWWGLLLCRLFMGLGMGVKISTIPVYSAEVAPAAVRGGIVTSFQLWVAFGIFVGFCSNLVWYRIGDLAWRFQLGAAFAPAVPVLIFVWFCPESPRWLMKKGRYQDSFRSFCRLRNTEMMAARDLYYAHRQLIVEKDAFGGRTLVRRMADLLTVPRLRRATLASSWIVVSQQFSGINIMAFYSSTIFEQAGYSTRNCLLASMGFGLVVFVFAFPAVYVMDTFGRRNLLLVTFPNMAWCLLAAGLCFLMDQGSSARVPLIAFFIYLFAAMYGPGIGPLPSIYFSEAFPLSHREIGSAFTICVNNAIGSALTLTFPELLHRIGPTRAFGLYAGLNMLAFVVIFFLIPETKQRTLEELDYIFGVPTRRHAAYQVRTWLPWVVRRYVFFERSAKLEPLYHLE